VGGSAQPGGSGSGSTPTFRERFIDPLFVDQAGDPQLVECAVLFVDLLGVGAMNSGPNVRANLIRIERAVTRMYRNFVDPESPWPAALFSDTLVLAAPTSDASDPEDAIGGLTVQSGWLQLNLAAEGLFMRGALTFGEFYIRDGVIFGPALVEAAQLEREHAVNPRVVLGKSAVAAQEDALASYRDPAESPQQALLLRDGDGYVFVNYLGLLFDEPADPEPPLAIHRDAIATQLAAYAADKRIWEKYRWAAEYHNAVCAKTMPAADHLLVPPAATTWTFQSFA
jgi:hypothetical protein